jgi:sugar diacid utilization regulator
MATRSHTPQAASAMRDLFAEPGDLPAAPQTQAPQAVEAVFASPPPPAVSPLSYHQAQQLMALGRAQGPQALTLAQHHAIWDCLQALPASQAWLSAQLQALQGELQERQP